MPIQYGVIACGAIAQRRHLPEIHANRHSNVAAVCDPLAERVESIAECYGATPYTDYKRMLRREDLDAVVVCSPNYAHARQTCDALNAGYHVLVEKPMATTRAEAKRMIETARKNRRYLMVGQNQRLMPAHVKAKEVLDSGRLGKVITFYTAFQHPGPDGWSIDGAKSWFFDKPQAALGVTGDLGVHKADLMRWLLGEEFATVGGTITTLDKKRGGKLIELDDNAQVVMTTRSGVVGTMIISWTNYGQESNDTMIRCQHGTMHIGGDPTYGVIVKYRNGNEERYKVGAMASNTRQTDSGVSRALTESIRRKRKPEIDGTEGYKSLMVILTAMSAAEQGKTLKIRY